MSESCKSVDINGVRYVRADFAEPAQKKDGMKYVIIRPGKASSVCAGYLKSESGTRVELVDSRRIWYWKGANTLSDLALYGVKVPDQCKFSPPLPEHIILDAAEIISCTEAGRLSIQGVPEWKA